MEVPILEVSTGRSQYRLHRSGVQPNVVIVSAACGTAEFCMRRRCTTARHVYNLYNMRNRVLILPIAAVVIVALCAYKVTRTDQQRAMGTRQTFGPAPQFELFDCQSPPHRVQLTSYLGRHSLLVLFFDGKLGADGDLRMKWVTENAERIAQADVYVFAISGALPYQNREFHQRLESGPLANRLYLLTDPPSTEGARAMGYLVHRQWGRYDEQTERPQQGFFPVDRAGRVELNKGRPAVVTLDDSKLAAFLEN